MADTFDFKQWVSDYKSGKLNEDFSKKLVKSDVAGDWIAKKSFVSRYMQPPNHITTNKPTEYSSSFEKGESYSGLAIHYSPPGYPNLVRLLKGNSELRCTEEDFIDNFEKACRIKEETDTDALEDMEDSMIPELDSVLEKQIRNFIEDGYDENQIADFFLALVQRQVFNYNKN